MLTIEDMFSALMEATKVQIAVNYARLVVETVDEEGEDLDEETIQSEMTILFNEQLEEFDNTMQSILGRIMSLKQETSNLQVVRDPDTIAEANRGKNA